jgi:hypothetical protein
MSIFGEREASDCKNRTGFARPDNATVKRKINFMDDDGDCSPKLKNIISKPKNMNNDIPSASVFSRLYNSSKKEQQEPVSRFAVPRVSNSVRASPKKSMICSNKNIKPATNPIHMPLFRIKKAKEDKIKTRIAGPDVHNEKNWLIDIEDTMIIKSKSFNMLQSVV